MFKIFCLLKLYIIHIHIREVLIIQLYQNIWGHIKSIFILKITYLFFIMNFIYKNLFNSKLIQFDVNAITTIKLQLTGDQMRRHSQYF